MYMYKNGMRYLAESKVKDGFHFHNDISVKIGKNIVRTIRLQIDGRLSAGALISFKTQMKKIHFVKLNNSKLTHSIDYIIENNEAIAFTFNLIDKDKIEIEGLT